MGTATRSLSSLWQRVFARDRVIEAGPARGLRFSGGAATGAFAPGTYEAPVQEALVSLVRPGDVCYDIGANLGFFTILFAKLTGDAGTVYAFEPVPGNAARIARNIARNGFGNAQVVEVALCSRDGMGDLLLARHVGGAVLKSVGAPPPDLAGHISVPTAALDTLIEQRGLRPPNLVKIDVEGAEMDVLQGMERTLKKWAPVLVIEVDDAAPDACEAKAASCADLLRTRGYAVRPLPNAYQNTNWSVRHFVAVKAQ
jgi:FkbM family methyltransferase